jgi:hypothetical protein
MGATLVNVLLKFRRQIGLQRHALGCDRVVEL